MLEVPTAGQVFVDGEELTAMTETQLRKARQNIGMIFQHFNLLASRTVFFDNIAFPLEIQGLGKDEIKSAWNRCWSLFSCRTAPTTIPASFPAAETARRHCPRPCQQPESSSVRRSNKRA